MHFKTLLQYNDSWTRLGKCLCREYQVRKGLEQNTTARTTADECGNVACAPKDNRHEARDLDDVEEKGNRLSRKLFFPNHRGEERGVPNRRPRRICRAILPPSSPSCWEQAISDSSKLAHVIDPWCASFCRLLPCSFENGLSDMHNSKKNRGRNGREGERLLGLTA